MIKHHTMQLTLFVLAVCVYHIKGSVIVDELHAKTRCGSRSDAPHCVNYGRCKDTHRCPIGEQVYSLNETQVRYYDRAYEDGNRTKIALSNDFEDWKTGTHKWKTKGEWVFPMKSLEGIATEKLDVIGDLDLKYGHIIFNTDTLSVRGDVQFTGKLKQTSFGTPVAVFNFASIFLGENVTTIIKGTRAIAILSRTSILFDTKVKILPGTVGGFQGGGYPTQNNANGPGSNSARIYMYTINTFADNVDEIQQIEISANLDQKIGGTFQLGYEGKYSYPISYDATASILEKQIENTFQVGNVHVEERGQPFAEVGRVWRVTFKTRIGNVPTFTTKSALSGRGAQVQISTVQDGNEISGYFKLSFGRNITRPIPYNASAADLESFLLTDFSKVLYARVERSDPLNICKQGTNSQLFNDLDTRATISVRYDPWKVPNNKFPQSALAHKRFWLCQSGAGPAGGYTWKVELHTSVNNITPTSPASPLKSVYGEAQLLVPIYTSPTTLWNATTNTSESILESTLLGTNAGISVSNDSCFSLAFGGSGGQFAGDGGGGYGPYHVKNYWNMSDLLGGSGGSSGGSKVYDVLPYPRPIFGGSGGGSIYLFATNDIHIGAKAIIHVGGSAGEGSSQSAGGGSGGMLVIQSRATIVNMGHLIANGGDGGKIDQSISGSKAGGGGGGGIIRIFAEAIVNWEHSSISAMGGNSQSFLGQNGLIDVQSHAGMQVRVDPLHGAAGSSKSLLVFGNEPFVHSSGRNSNVPVSLNGPQYIFQDDDVKHPTRAYYFFRIDQILKDNVKYNRGAIFALHSANMMDEVLIGVGLVDGWLNHGANFYDYPRQQFHEKIHLKRWYKIDIRINWMSKTYDIFLNDVQKVANAPFIGDELAGVGLYNYHHMATWWDEIYVGLDHTFGFRCPQVKDSELLLQKRLRRLWSAPKVGDEVQYDTETRNLNHLSERSLYQFDNGNLVSFDGPPHKIYSDERNVDYNDEEVIEDEVMAAGELLEVEFHQDNSVVDLLETSADHATLTTASNGQSYSHTDLHERSRIRPTHYWYSEVHQGNSGGIGACSTVDFITWRNEGIMQHFANLTDPFGDVLNHTLIGELPKVIYNAESNRFVMWLHVDTQSNKMGLAGVATSEFANGPFHFNRSFYPDAPLEAPGALSINETHDQTILSQPNGRAYLVRNYYKTVNYWLPRPVMDPIWQSVKKQDGTTDFGLSYHRAVFHEGYDDVDDTYLQRWRGEDVPWKIECCDADNNCKVKFDIPTEGFTRACAPGLKKNIIGQGVIPITSRYKDPRLNENNEFRAKAVPSHTTWGHQAYNIKTWRGNYFDALSANITNLVFHNYAHVLRNSEYFINVTDVITLNRMLDELGVPISKEMLAEYTLYDLNSYDINIDWKITLDEISSLQDNKHNLKPELRAHFLKDTELLRANAKQILDANSDLWISYTEFASWIGRDPDLLFNQFDLDKSGYLDENELARFLSDRLVPRIDTVIILLDPDFNGQVFYDRFAKWVHEAPAFIFNKFDFDDSNDLDASERQLLFNEIGNYFMPSDEILQSFNDLINPINNRISKADHLKWFAASTSLLRGSRNHLKVDNAVHPTRPDQLTGPMHVVETRRAKYVAISELASDFTSTKGLLTEIEGDFEGDAALIEMLSASVQLFNLEAYQSVTYDKSFRRYLTPDDLGHAGWYWNGAEFEPRKAAPPHFQYAEECINIAGVLKGCPKCHKYSPYASPRVHKYQTEDSTEDHCANDKIMDAYIKAFDQQSSKSLQFQQLSQYGSQGLQPHYSPCVNQSESTPCDIHKVIEGGRGDPMDVNISDWNLRWDRNRNYKLSSMKLRASELQTESRGMTFHERFPNRERAPIGDFDTGLHPDQLDDPLGGGR